MRLLLLHIAVHGVRGREVFGAEPTGADLSLINYSRAAALTVGLQTGLFYSSCSLPMPTEAPVSVALLVARQFSLSRRKDDLQNTQKSRPSKPLNDVIPHPNF